MTETIETIPLSKLRPSEANIRKTLPSAEIETLAASIEAHGLLQNLTVRAAETTSGRKRGMHEVVAGGRRLTALRLLAKRKRIPKDFGVPCRMLGANDGDNATELSLAENIVRAPVHPADQFEAFSKLHAEGLGAEDVAARFGISPNLVLQRLKLAAVSPRLMAVYREGGMTLDQLTAFAISDDLEAQERVWFDAPYGDQSPQAIRRALTISLVEGSDRRARFVGAEAYEAAGGTIIRDLFEPENIGYFTDSALLDRLVAERLEKEAAQVRKEGWAWVDVELETDYGRLASFGRVPITEVPLSDEDEARLREYCERHDAIVTDLDDEPSEEVAAELDALSAKIDALSQRKETWSDADKARAGALLSIDYRGELQITRGLLKPEASSTRKASKGSRRTRRVAETSNGLPVVLLEELSAHRTAALREALAGNQDVAFTALLHALVLRTFFGPILEPCIDIRPVVAELPATAGGVGESKAVAALAERHRTWSERLPAPEELWQWLSAQDLDTKLDLLVYCTARTVNALQTRNSGQEAKRLAHVEILASALGLDMAEWWRPTKERYFDKVTKRHILAAVEEAVSPQAAENIARMKKEAMAARAEELLAEKRWLPEPLRTAS